jgi:hypothetical protein
MLPTRPTAVPEEKVGVAVAPVNNTMHSLFSRVDVYLQNKMVTESDTPYPYQSYLKALLNTTDCEKDGPMQSQLFYKCDKSFDDLNWLVSDEHGFRTRGLYFDSSNEVELLGGLSSDVFEIGKLIPNGVGLTITLYPATPEFALLSELSNTNAKIVITKATLKLFSVSVSPEIAAAHAEVLQTHPAVYMYTKTEVKRFTLAKGLFSTDVNDPFGGRVPSELVIGVVKARASHGSFTEDPFAFKHFRASRVHVTVDGADIGEGAIETKFVEDSAVRSSYLDAYRSLRGSAGREDECPVSRMAYYEGHNVFYRFVTNPETARNPSSDSNDVTPLRRLGNVRVSLRFEEELPEAMTVIMFAKFPAGLKIDKNRSVTEM